MPEPIKVASDGMKEDLRPMHCERCGRERLFRYITQRVEWAEDDTIAAVYDAWQCQECGHPVGEQQDLE